jgi:hypothetical protein
VASVVTRSVTAFSKTTAQTAEGAEHAELMNFSAFSAASRDPQSLDFMVF